MSTAGRVTASLAFQIGVNGDIVRRKKVLSFRCEDTLQRVYETIAGHTGGSVLWPKDFGDQVDAGGIAVILVANQKASLGAATVWERALPGTKMKDFEVEAGGSASLLLRVQQPDAVDEKLLPFNLAMSVPSVRVMGTFLHVDEDDDDKPELSPRALSDPGSSHAGSMTPDVASVMNESAEIERLRRRQQEAYIRKKLMPGMSNRSPSPRHSRIKNFLDSEAYRESPRNVKIPSLETEPPQADEMGSSSASRPCIVSESDMVVRAGTAPPGFGPPHRTVGFVETPRADVGYRTATEPRNGIPHEQPVAIGEPYDPFKKVDPVPTFLGGEGRGFAGISPFADQGLGVPPRVNPWTTSEPALSPPLWNAAGRDMGGWNPAEHGGFVPQRAIGSIGPARTGAPLQGIDLQGFPGQGLLQGFSQGPLPGSYQGIVPSRTPAFEPDLGLMSVPAPAARSMAFDGFDDQSPTQAANANPGPPELLFDAVTRGDTVAIRELIKAGGDINQITERGSRILFRAVIKAHDSEIVRLILEAKADVRSLDDKGNSVFHFWARATVGRNHLMEIGQMLVAAKADVEARRTKDGMSPLHHVTIGHNNRRGWLDFHKALFLIRNGASPGITTERLEQPSDLLTKDSRATTKKLVQLLQYGTSHGDWPRCDHSECCWCN